MGWRMTILTALVVAAEGVARAQEPAPVAQSREDIDGDGRADVVSIDSGGSMTVSVTGSKRLAAWKVVASSGRVVDATIDIGDPAQTGGHRSILAVVDIGTVRGGPTRREATILVWKSGTLEELWRGEVQRSRDGAEQRIEHSPFGLIRYTHRPGIARCDGRDAYLYASRFDFGGRRFRPASQPVRVRASTTLRAAPTRPASLAAGTGRLFRDPRVSSALGIDDPLRLAPPHEVLDGSDTTGWIEGKGGFGRGEFLTVRSPLDAAVLAVRIVPGIDGQRRFNRPRRLALLVGDKAYWVEFSTDPQPREHWIALPEPVESRCLSLVLDQVWPASAQSRNTGATAIAEVEVFTDLDVEPEKAARALVARVVAGGAGEQTARHLIARLGADVAIPVLRKAVAAHPAGAERMRLLRVAAALPGAPDLLGEGLVTAVRPADIDAFADALAALGAESIPALVAAISSEDAPEERRERAMQILAGIDGKEALDQLAAFAGKGSRSLRRSLAAALAHRPADDSALLLAAAAAAESRGDLAAESDLWRGIGLHLGRHAQARATSADAISARLREATDYELTTRLLEAAGLARTEVTTQAIARRLEALRASEAIRPIVLRRIATAALAAGTGPAAQQALRGSLEDADPGVRLAALSALQDRDPDDASFDDALVAALRDTWPDVRRASAAALGTRCQRPGPTAGLQTSAETDDSSRVATTALVGVVGCLGPRAADVVLAILADRKRPVDVRITAARLVEDVASAALLPRVLDALRSEKARALEQESSRRVAAALALAVGTAFRQPEAVTELVQMARDPAFPGLQAAALEGLSSHCPAELKALLHELSASAQERVVALAVQRARARCR